MAGLITEWVFAVAGFGCGWAGWMGFLLSMGVLMPIDGLFFGMR